MKVMCTKKLKQLKHSSLKIQEAMPKKCCDYWKKMKIKFTNQGHLSTNVTPDIGLKDEPVLKYDVLVVANTFVNNCKQIATLSFKFFEKT